MHVFDHGIICVYLPQTDRILYIIYFLFFSSLCVHEVQYISPPGSSTGTWFRVRAASVPLLCLVLPTKHSGKPCNMHHSLHIRTLI